MATATIKDQQIIDAIKAAINTIAAGAEYYTTLTAYDSEPSPIDDGVNIHEGDEEIIGSVSSGTIHDCRLPVYLDIVLKNADAANIRKAKADVLKCLYNTNMLGGLAFNIQHIRTETNLLDQNGNLIAHRRIVIEVYYRKNAFSLA